MQVVAQFLVPAAIAEALTQAVKSFVDIGRRLAAQQKLDEEEVTRLVALSMAMFVAAGARVDVFALLGIQFGIPGGGVVAAGLLLSRGAGFVHDLWDRAQTLLKPSPLP